MTYLVLMTTNPQVRICGPAHAHGSKGVIFEVLVVTHTTKKRMHFRISCEAISRLDELVDIANRTTIRRTKISRSDILEQLILKNTRNKLDVLEEKIREHAKEINRLQEEKQDLMERAGQKNIKDYEEKEKIEDGLLAIPYE